MGKFFNLYLMHMKGSISDTKKLEQLRKEYNREQSSSSETEATAGTVYPPHGEILTDVPTGQDGEVGVGRTNKRNTRKRRRNRRSRSSIHNRQSRTGLRNKAKDTGSPQGTPAVDEVKAAGQEADASGLSQMERSLLSIDEQNDQAGS